MSNLTSEQRIALAAIDAAGSIAEAAGATAQALIEAARALRQAVAPEDDGGNFTVANQEPCCGDCGWPPAEDLVEDDEAPEENDGEAPRYTLDVMRSDAGFTSDPIRVGGHGGLGGCVYWRAADLGITHDMLLEACEGLSDDERRAAHERAANAAAMGRRTPTVRDLLNGLAVIKRRKLGGLGTSAAPEDDGDAPRELLIERPLDIVRSNAGFTSGPVWVGGPGAYEGPHCYWTEADRGLTHAMLMDACKGLSLEGRRQAHIRAGVAGQTVTALYNALLAQKRVEMAAYEASFDLAADLDWEPGDDGMEPPTTCPADVGDIPHEDALVEEINARFGSHDSASVAAQEAVEAPKPVEPSLSAAKSETGSSASPAAPAPDLDSAYGADLDALALEQFGVRRSVGEPDTSFRAFLRAKDSAGDLKAGVWPGISGSQSVELRGPLFPPPVGHVVAGTNDSVND